MKINGVELEYDFMDVEDRADYENKMLEIGQEIEEKMEKAKENPITSSTMMREICEKVNELIDYLFGEGTAKKVFGERVHFKKCFTAYIDIIKEVKRQDAEMEEMVKENMENIVNIDSIEAPKMNREQRRKAKKH